MKIEKSTIIRTAVLVFALINQGLNIAGKNTLPFTEDEVSNFIAYALTIGSALYSWWKNNSFTTAALAADLHLKTLKSGTDAEASAETPDTTDKEGE